METARPADDGGRPDYFNLPRGEFDALYFSPVYLSRSGEALLFSKMDLDGDGEDDMLELSTVTNYDMACTVKLSGGVSYSFETYCRNIEKLSLADLTGDGRPELIFMGENGGNGGNGGHNIYILHADGDGNIVELPLPVIDSYTGYSFTFKFLDGYRFAVSGEEPLPGTFELSGEDAAYFTKYFNLFDENGKALPRQEHKYPDEAGETDRPYDYAVNMEPDGALTLSLYSYTWFGSHVCHMGNGISTVKWDGERLVLVSQGFER